jgi:hypothetical protein
LILGYVPASFPFVFALLGVVLSYATSMVGAPGAAVAANEPVCPVTGGSACEAPAPTADDLALDYATPAEVDCPAPQGRTARLAEAHPAFAAAAFAPGGFADCSPPVLDFHYRVSRVPESERPNGALRPQRARRNGPAVAACTGLPLERGTPLSTGSVQPAAMYALLTMLPPTGASIGFGATEDRPSRALEPLDRPPRA